MTEEDRQKLNEQLRRISPETWKIGKHRGRYMKELPGRYLVWCLNHMELSTELRIRVVDEIRRRLA